jgi:uncharacterized DUF497 family protein
LTINELIVDPGREEHIADHHVTAREAREVALGHHTTFRTRQDRYGLIGQTDAGRYLTVIVTARGGGVYALITARDADAAERRRYGRRGG